MKKIEINVAMDENEKVSCHSTIEGVTTTELGAVLCTLVEEMARSVCNDAVSESLFICSIAQVLLELQGQKGYDEE